MSDCTIFAGKRDRDGYGQLYDPATKKVVRAHRAAYERHHGVKLRRDQVIRHTCDNPPCINPAHLLVGTHADNSNDKVARGRQCKGSDIGISVLTEAQIPHIRELLKQGNSRAKIARSYQVSHSTISRIARGLTWRHV